MGDPSRARVSGPLARYAAGFLAELVSMGYRPVSSAFQLQLMAHLSRWLEANELAVGELSSVQVERFLAARRGGGLRELPLPEGVGAAVGVSARFGRGAGSRSSGAVRGGRVA